MSSDLLRSDVERTYFVDPHEMMKVINKRT